MSKTVRISEETNNNLDQLSKSIGKSKQDIVEKAVNLLARQYFLKKASKAYEALKKNKKTWKEELEERGEWDVTLDEGLSDD